MVEPEVNEKGDVLVQNLRYNVRIQVGNCHISKPLFGLQTVSDIFDLNINRFKSLEEINRITSSPIGILTYNQLKSAINNRWGGVLKAENHKVIMKTPFIKNRILYI